MRRDDLVRGLAVLDPVRERVYLVKRIRAFASTAVIHSRNHEQAHLVIGFRLAAVCRHRLLIELDADERRNRRIVPAVIEKQLAAVGEELFQFGRIDCIDRVVAELIRTRGVGVEVEGVIVPV